LVPGKCDILVIGGGIIGLTVARELLLRGAEDVLLIEKESAPGKHASGRNSGVLHAGVYYTPDTFKARFCIEGNRRMKEYCREKGLPLLDTGKVIVARKEAEVPVLEELSRRGRANGIEVKEIGAQELKEIEPHASTCDKALYSPNTSVVDPVKILQALENELLSSGRLAIHYNTAFVGLSSGRSVVTSRGRVTFNKLINAAGAYSDFVAHAFDAGRGYRILPFKGTYKKLHPEAGHLVRTSIYPVPDLRNPFLGVHFTRGVYGEVTIGPTAIPALGRENYGLFRGVGPESISILWRDAVLFVADRAFRTVALTEVRKYSRHVFTEEAGQLVPAVKNSDIIPCSKVGIRPQLVDWRRKRLVGDFVVLKDGDAIHVLNAISPAFTSAMPFAEYVVDRLLS
jgi:L-2-hydroxyglutarate oxidase LhgO